MLSSEHSYKETSVQVLYSFIESLFSSDVQLRQFFGWGTIDFAAYPAVAIIITFFIAAGFRNQLLPKPFAVLVVAAISLLALRGAALNEHHWDLLSCDILPEGATDIAARPATAYRLTQTYRLTQCEGRKISAVDFEKKWGSLGDYHALVLRSDDALGGYLRESGEWEVAERSRSKNTFLRGFGDAELSFESFRIKASG